MLLSPMELDTTMRMILQVPIWAQRVIYIQGSCLKDGDLSRARMNEAEACFILAARNYADKTAAVSCKIRLFLYVGGRRGDCISYA